MLTRWTDFDRSFAALNELRRQMDAWLGEFESGRRGATPAALGYSWPLVNLYDNGTELVLSAAAPGLAKDDLELTITGDTLALSGKRSVTVPEGYSVHRQERGNVEFARSFALPAKVNPEKIAATVKDGLLTIKMAKAEEAKPRQITVKAG